MDNPNPVTICHMSSAHNRDDVRIFHKQCCSLEDAGFEVHFVVANGKPDEEINNVRIHDVGKLKGRFSRIFISTWRVLMRASKINAQIYHFHDPELLFAGLWLRIKGKKVIYDIHEDLPRQILAKAWIYSILRKMISFTAELVENFIAKRLSAVVTATPFILERFDKVGARAINVNNFPILKEFNSNIKWDNRLGNAVYIGGISEVRGIGPLIDAMEHSDAKLNLAGSYTPSQFREELLNKNGWSNVIEYGFVDRKKVQEILQKSKIGIVTLLPIVNYLDSLPIKMFEYMASGIPFVASDFPYWKSIVEKHKCGLCVDPRNPDDIADAIKYLLNNDVEAQAMGKRGKEAVMKFYNWNNEANKLINLYEALSEIKTV